MIRRITAKTKVLGYAALTDVNLAGERRGGSKRLDWGKEWSPWGSGTGARPPPQKNEFFA